MSINEIIINALSDLAPTYPWNADENDGDIRDIRRIVFNYDTVPVTFGDDTPVFERYLLQVHYFCPRNDNTVDIRAKIKIALFMADDQMTFPEETAVTGTDDEEQHFCFECECMQLVEV